MGKGFEELDAWKAAAMLVTLVHRQVLPRLPQEERFALALQLRRSILSVPANIAEAHGRHHFKDATRFCYVARGSLEESMSHLRIARALGYIADDLFAECDALGAKSLALLNGYIRYLSRLRSHPGRANEQITNH